jgi:hypothetical protein
MTPFSECIVEVTVSRGSHILCLFRPWNIFANGSEFAVAVFITKSWLAMLLTPLRQTSWHRLVKGDLKYIGEVAISCENASGCETEAQRETLDEKTGGKNLVRLSLEIDTSARFRKQLFSELNHHNSALMCIGNDLQFQIFLIIWSPGRKLYRLCSEI